MPVHNAVSIACRLAIGIIRLLARCRGTTIVATVLVGCLQAAAQDSTVPVQSQEWAVTAQVTSIKASAEFAKLAASERLIDRTMIISRDGEHHAYIKSKGLKQQVVVIDGLEGDAFDTIFHIETHGYHNATDMGAIPWSSDSILGLIANRDLSRVVYGAKLGNTTFAIIHDRGKAPRRFPMAQPVFVKSTSDEWGVWRVSPDAGLILFERRNDAGGRWFKIGEDGAQVGPVTQYVLHWSRSGDSVCYCRPFPAPKRGVGGAVVVNGKNVTELLVNYPGILVGFGPDGKGVAWCALPLDQVRQQSPAFGEINGKRFELPSNHFRESKIYLSPDGNRFAIAAQLKDSSLENVYTVDGKAHESYRSLSAPVFSKDSKSLAYSVSNRETHAVILDGEVIQTSQRVDGLAFGPTSNHFAYWGTNVINVRRPEGESTLTTRGRPLLFTPSGKHLMAIDLSVQVWRGSFYFDAQQLAFKEVEALEKTWDIQIIDDQRLQVYGIKHRDGIREVVRVDATIVPKVIAPLPEAPKSPDPVKPISKPDPQQLPPETKKPVIIDR